MIHTGTFLYNSIDLHGLSSNDAERVLNYWLSTSARKGMGKIRFITGRGNHVNTKGERGTLYKSFLSWIEKSPFKDRVEQCAQHDGYFEITLKTTQKQNPTADFFKTTAKQFIDSNADAIKIYAEKGEVYFQLLYAKMLEEGKGIKQDFKQAFKFYSLAANNNYPAAMHALARCYLHGIGVRPDKTQAIIWLKKADELNYIEATVSLGDSYWLGNGVNEDDRTALSYYAKAAAQKHPVGMRNLARAYSQGYGIDKNLENAFKWYKAAADLGDTISQYNVGILYQNGLGVSENNEQAWRYLLMAAENGDPDAQCVVGVCYLRGKSVNKDQANAIEWLKKAAANGSQQAIHELSLIGDDKSKQDYLKKSAESGNFFDKMRLHASSMSKQQLIKLVQEELEKNSRLPLDDIALLDHDNKFLLLDWMLMAGKTPYKEKALKVIEVMAEQKCIFSLRRLYMLYANGFAQLKIQKDINKAIKYLQQASKLGDSKSMVYLGDLYLEGQATTQSLITAFSFYQQALKQRNPIACYRVAIFYMKGQVIAQDFSKAQQSLAEAILLERKSDVVNALKSGIMDEYFPITEEALLLFNDLKAGKNVQAESSNQSDKTSVEEYKNPRSYKI